MLNEFSWPYQETKVNSNVVEFFEIRDINGKLRWLQSTESRKPDFLLTLTSKRITAVVYKVLVQVCFKMNLQGKIFNRIELTLCQDAKNLFNLYRVKSIAVMLGMTGPSAKNILILHTETDKILYLKSAKSKLSFSLIKTEYNALKLLEGIDISFATPLVLDIGNEFLLTSSVGQIKQTRKWVEVHTNLLRDLYKLGIEVVSTKEFFQYNFPDGYLGILDDKIEVAYSHGDFTPWNMTIKQGQLQVIDWEMFGLRPLGYDYFHFHIQTQIMNTMNDADFILNYIDGQPSISSDLKGDLNCFGSKGLFLYLLTVFNEYHSIYSAEDDLHWQARRALTIWAEMLEILYEKNLRVFNKKI